MRQAFRFFCCILFLWPCLSVLTGKTVEETGILATPVGKAPLVPTMVNYRINELGRPSIFALPITDGNGMGFIKDMKVYSSRPDELNLPSLFGKLETIDGAVVFFPKFNLQPGLEYFIQVIFEEQNEPTLFSFLIPKENNTSVATVSAVYPSRSELPENLLKFYIHFSHPMSVGNVYDYIHLIDEDGKEVELPFLELGEELWDYDSQRLTLLFDPGRIKTGLVPNLQEGLALHAGRSYTLKIDGDWEDARGQPMIEGFEKAFTVTAGDTVSPNPYNWEKTWPSADTKEPIVLTFPESLDEALLQRVLIVQNKYTQVMNGTVKVSDHETRWEFTPAVNWQPGKYRLEIETILEDVAGNSIARPFELEKTESENYRAGPEMVHLNFEVQ